MFQQNSPGICIKAIAFDVTSSDRIYYAGVIVLEKGNLFAIGEFARKAGITGRTLRFYDNIGLLKPSYIDASGRRYYSSQDFAKLQKILTLKFIGLSLDEISNIIKYDVTDSSFRKSLEIQKEIIDKKIHHMKMVADAIDEALGVQKAGDLLNWDKIINIINVINMDNNWLKQYENASNLRARISIHELYSTNKHGWMRWFFEQLDIPCDSKILELGCGDGSLWAKNIDRIPDGWDITLTDFSKGMLKDAKKLLARAGERFKFNVVDAQSIPYEDESFDVVIANHMLYHVPDMDMAFAEIERVLKHGGQFFASTVGQAHMVQMREIVAMFEPDIANTKSFSHTERFQLENGMEKVSKWFKDVSIKRYQDSLNVTDPGALIDYIFSMPGNIKENMTMEKLKAMVNYLKDEINANGGIHITKDTGFFHGIKR